MAERVSQLSPEQKPSLQRHDHLQERIRARGAVSPQLPNAVHPAVRDLVVTRARKQKYKR